MDNKIAVQDAPLNSGVLNADGIPVTAQELYDAYMNGMIRFCLTMDNITGFADVISFLWYDSNGKSVNTQDVQRIQCMFLMNDYLYKLTIYSGEPR